jgi:hypothetical protein
MTATDSFNPTDAEGLAAWFARAEDNATRLRRRLIVLGGLAPWRDLPEPEPLPEPMCQGPKSGPAARGTAQTHNSLPMRAQAPAGPGNRPRRRGQNRRPRRG